MSTFELRSPVASVADPEISGLREFSVIDDLLQKDGAVIVTVREPESPSEVEEHADAVFHLDRLGFLKAKQ